MSFLKSSIPGGRLELENPFLWYSVIAIGLSYWRIEARERVRKAGWKKNVSLIFFFFSICLFALLEWATYVMDRQLTEGMVHVAAFVMLLYGLPMGKMVLAAATGMNVIHMRYIRIALGSPMMWFENPVL